jgi:hypothetical protein
MSSTSAHTFLGGASSTTDTLMRAIAARPYRRRIAAPIHRARHLCFMA